MRFLSQLLRGVNPLKVGRLHKVLSEAGIAHDISDLEIHYLASGGEFDSFLQKCEFLAQGGETFDMDELMAVHLAGRIDDVGCAADISRLIQSSRQRAEEELQSLGVSDYDQGKLDEVLACAIGQQQDPGEKVRLSEFRESFSLTPDEEKILLHFYSEIFSDS